MQEFPLQRSPSDGIERAERLVHQENWRIGGQSAGNAYSLALSTRKLTWMPRGQLRIESDQLQEFLHTLSDALRRPSLKLRHERDIALDGEVGKQPDFLDHVTNRAPKADQIPITKRAAVNPDFSATRGQQAVNDFERGGFSRPA